MASLLALAVASVLAALAVRRSRVLPAWTGWLLAAGFVLYLPQFFRAGVAAGWRTAC